MEHETTQDPLPLPPNPFLQIIQNPDGTITRPTTPTLPPSTTPSLSSDDIPLDPHTNTALRLYLPTTPKPQRLPTLLFIHGGGFSLFSPSSAPYHLFSSLLSSHLPALILSLHHRLSPDHRLPAAYHDAVHAIRALRSIKHPFVRDHADLSRVYVFGSSSGANIAFHAALSPDCPPLAGLVLNQPFFGGVERTPSEAASEDDPVLPLGASDLLWRLALPLGADRDHVFCNPVRRPPEGVGRLPRCLVVGCEGDPLVDRQRAFVGMLEGEGVEVEARFGEGGLHAVELFDEEWARRLAEDVRRFVYGGGGGGGD